jgi:protoporphyrinogen oxidase
MRIGIIGAGFTGLAAAHRLTKAGNDVHVFEMDPQPGGLAIGYQEKTWEWSLEKHYHHWFTNDNAVLALAKEINFDVIIRRPKTSSYVDSDIVQLDSPLTLLQFPKLHPLERLRMAFVLGLLRFNPIWKPLERVGAHDVLSGAMGKKAYEMLWEPLLVNKFGSFASTVSLAWFWARIKKRTTSLAYPEGGFLRFAERLTDVVGEHGATVSFNTAVTAITTKGQTTQLSVKSGTKTETHEFDRIIVTLPGFQFAKLAPTLPSTYTKQLLALKGLGAVNLVLRLNKPFFADNTYWLSVCEKNAPVLAIVEHTNFMDKKHYGNEHLVYLGNYVPMNHPYFTQPKETILKTILPYLERINPNVKATIIDFEKFTAPFAQPVIPVNYSKIIPPFTTPIKHVYLANMQQVYPWDRGTNYAVELGEKVAGLLLDSS